MRRGRVLEFSFSPGIADFVALLIVLMPSFVGVMAVVFIRKIYRTLQMIVEKEEKLNYENFKKIFCSKLR